MTSDNEYDEKMTEAILNWCDQVDSIKDDDELPTLVHDTNTELLMGVYEHYDALLDDHRKLGNDEAPFSAWDQKVMSTLHAALRERGLTPVSSEVADMLDEVLGAMPPQTVH
jgi:hypothetical protein